MKVLLIIENLSIGGTSTSFINLISALRGYPEVDFTVGLVNMEAQSMLPKDVKFLDLSCFSRSRKNITEKLIHNIRAGLSCRLRLKLSRFLKKHLTDYNKNLLPMIQACERKEACAVGVHLDVRADFDIVISWCEMYTDYLLAYRITSARKLAWIHPDYEQAGFSKKIDREMISDVDGVVAVSQTGCKSLQRAFPNYSSKCHFIYNKLDISEIRAKSKRHEIQYKNDAINIITVARIQNVSKAFDRTLFAMRRIKDAGFKFMWRIIGEGEDKVSVLNQISNLHLEEEVHLLGADDNPFPYVAASDLFLLASYYEGFPMVVEEALALGVPVMITEYAAAKEQINDGVTGIIIPNTAQGIYDGLTGVLEHPERLDTICNNLATQSFKRYDNCDDFVALLKQVTESGVNK